MVCCLIAPSHYLNKCCHIISEVRWQSLEYGLSASEMILWDKGNWIWMAPNHNETQVIHRNGKVVRSTTLVFTGHFEACHQCLQWISRPLSWLPFCFNVCTFLAVCCRFVAKLLKQYEATMISYTAQVFIITPQTVMWVEFHPASNMAEHGKWWFYGMPIDNIELV